MTDPTARSDAAPAPEDASTSAERSPAQPEQAKTATPPAESDPLVERTREAAEYKDKLLRTLAEMENLRRRTEREVSDARVYGIAAFARDTLAVADNMDRALKQLGAELREKADASIKALLDGVELTERELLKVLEKHGVRKFEPQGEKFDPNLHQAMYEVADPSLPTGTVAQVIQAGYMIGDRMLRPALVAVTKNGPKPGAAGPVNDNAPASPDPQGAA
jgi:molecular chaperone GrpE